MQKYYTFFTIALFLFFNKSYPSEHFSDGDRSLFTPDSRRLPGRCDLMQASTTLQKKTQNDLSLYMLVLVEKKDISELLRILTLKIQKDKENAPFLLRI